MAISTYTYANEVSSKYNQMTQELLEQLPPYCTSFVNSIYETTSARTRCGYLQDLKIFFHWLKTTNSTLKDTKIENIDASILDKLVQDDILEFLRWLEHYELDGKPYSNGPSGKKRKISSVRRFYKFLTTTKGYIDNNPAIKVDTPKIKEKEIRTLEGSERNSLFLLLSNNYQSAKRKLDETPAEKLTYRIKQGPAIAIRDKAIVYLFLGTGMRISELVGIDIGDINYELQRINILRKGGKYDHVYMSKDVFEAVNEYLQEYRKDLESPFDAIESALFLSYQGTRITPRSIERIIRSLADQALGTKSGITPHKFRSTFGTQYYKETRDIFATASVLGHSSIETTKRHYVKPGEEAKLNMKDIDIFNTES